MHPRTPLTFAAVDAIAFAPAAAPASVPAFHPALLGALVELTILYAQETLGATDIGAVVKAHPLGSMFSARDANVVVQLSLHAGYLRLAGRFAPATELTRLSIVTKRAAEAGGFDDRAASQLSAAVGEMLGNIIEGSEAPGTGLVAFQARDGRFELVVADQGIGALTKPSFQRALRRPCLRPRGPPARARSRLQPVQRSRPGPWL